MFWDNNDHIQHLLISKWSCRFILSALCSSHTDSDEGGCVLGGVVLLTDWCQSFDKKRLTEAVLTNGVLCQPFTSACNLPDMTELTSGCGDKMLYKTLQRPNCCFCMFSHLFYTSPVNVTNPTFSLINAFFRVFRYKTPDTGSDRCECSSVFEGTSALVLLQSSATSVWTPNLQNRNSTSIFKLYDSRLCVVIKVKEHRVRSGCKLNLFVRCSNVSSHWRRPSFFLVVEWRKKI